MDEEIKDPTEKELKNIEGGNLEENESSEEII